MVTTSCPGYPCGKERTRCAVRAAPSSTCATSRTRTGDAAAGADDDFAELIGRSDASEGAQSQFLRASDHAAAGRFDVFALQRIAHIEHGEIVRGEFLRVEQHANLPRLPAIQIDAADAIHGLDGAPHLLVGNLRQFAAADGTR